MQYKCARGCLDLFLVAFVAKRAVCRGNRSGRVVGAAKRVCGNRAVKCRRPQSAVYNLRSTVCGGRWSYDGPRTDLQKRERPVLCGCSVLLLRAGAGRWIYGMQMRQVRRFGALDSKNDPQKDFYHKEHQTHIDRTCNASITRHPPWKKRVVPGLDSFSSHNPSPANHNTLAKKKSSRKEFMLIFILFSDRALFLCLAVPG